MSWTPSSRVGSLPTRKRWTALGRPSVSPVRDDLQSWLRVRSQVEWDHASQELVGPIRGRRDGVDAAAAVRHEPDDAARGDRMRAAWRLARAHAAASRPLGFGLLAEWQRIVLGHRDISFRTLPAFGKKGRERYGLSAETPARFEECLAQATSADTALLLPARAARAYLDVCFFHPFDDGNGRAALLTLAFVLAREDVFLGDVGPLQVRRYADDPIGALALARLVRILALQSDQRAHAVTRPAAGTTGTPACHRPSFTRPSTRW
ncbi:Fic family protein [Streptomyces sp. NPDC048527]|uniref:Fic family protein n=1 Tax=Streptomyces sp. NPDC048527 TaxID=3365568 RepID=UPI003710BBEB